MDTVKKYLDNFFENEYNSSILSFFNIIWNNNNNEITGIVVKLFSNIIFRLVILTLIFYGGNKPIAFINNCNYIYNDNGND